MSKINDLQRDVLAKLRAIEADAKEAQQYSLHAATLMTMSGNIARACVDLSYIAGQIKAAKEDE